LELITKAELARRIGITRQAIDKAVKKGRLRLVGEGRSAKIDFHDSLAVIYMNDHSASRQVAKKLKDQDDTNKNITPEKQQQLDAAGESTQLRDEKLRIQTKKLRMEMAEKMGELVLRSGVEKAFGKLTSSIISYIFPIGDRVSPGIAGVFKSTDQDNINETKRMIDKEIGRALEAVKKDIQEYLTDIK